MNTRITPLAAAVLMAAATMAQAAPARTDHDPAAASRPEARHAGPPATKSAAAEKSPTDWIEFDDLRFTPVVDPVTRDLADARKALDRHEPKKAAVALRSAARRLVHLGKADARTDQALAKLDAAEATATRKRMDALAARLETTATDVEAGRIPTRAAFDRSMDQISRDDLDQRWLVTDVETWYAVSDEPQKHFAAARQDFDRKDMKAAAREVRKAAAYLRLEGVRAKGDALTALDAAEAELDGTAAALEHGAVDSVKSLDRAFAMASRALATAQRAEARASWGKDARIMTAYELKAAARSLEGAAAWTTGEMKAAAHAAAVDARALGERLLRGGHWTEHEAQRTFAAMDRSIARIGESLHGGQAPSRG